MSSRLGRNLRIGDKIRLRGVPPVTHVATVVAKPEKTSPGHFSRDTRYRVPLDSAPWWWGKPELIVYSDTRLELEP